MKKELIGILLLGMLVFGCSGVKTEPTARDYAQMNCLDTYEAPADVLLKCVKFACKERDMEVGTGGSTIRSEWDCIQNGTTVRIDYSQVNYTPCKEVLDGINKTRRCLEDINLIGVD